MILGWEGGGDWTLGCEAMSFPLDYKGFRSQLIVLKILLTKYKNLEGISHFPLIRHYTY